MAMCVMAVVAAAPCQCFSPGANQITSPGRISSIGPPQRRASPRPAVTTSVWPSGCVCHAVRAPGSKVTLAPTTRAGSGAVNSGSMRTVPVKYSAGPFPEGCEPLRWMSKVLVLCVGRSAAGHLLELLRISRAEHRNLCGGAIDLAEIVGSQLESRRAGVLLEPLLLCGARNGHNPRLLRQQPGERDLCRARLLQLAYRTQQIHQPLIRLPGLRREARHDVAEIGAVEGRVLVDLSREEALAERTEGDEPDAEFLERRQQFLLRGSPPQRVFAL